MDDTSRRPRRSLVVMALDAMLGLVTAVQTGNLPGVRRRPGRPAPSRRTGLLWLAAGVLVVAGGTTILIGALLRAPGGLADLPPAERAAPAPPATSSIAAPAATVTHATSSPTPRASVSLPLPAISAAASASVPATVPSAGPSTPVAGHLTAGYAAAGTGLLGYRASVTLAAQGPGPSTDWRLTVTLPRSTLLVTAVSGATAEQDGAVWTFTPDASTRTIAPGGSVVIAYDVRGATLVDAQPTDCRIDGEPCAGLPG